MSVRRFQRLGFTLAEILCVVVILGITSAVILPQLGTRKDLKTAAAARVVMADLMYAQNRAISRQTHVYVVFDTTAGAYSLQEGSPLAKLEHPVNHTDYQVTFGEDGQTGLEDVTLASAAFDTETVLAFDELGAPYAYNAVTGLSPLLSGQIQLSCEGYVLTMSIEPYTGEITVDTP